MTMPSTQTMADIILTACARASARHRRELDDPEGHLADMIAEAKADPAQFIGNRQAEALDAAISAAWFPGPGLLDLLDGADTWESPAVPVSELLRHEAIERRWGAMLKFELRDLRQEGEDATAEAVQREWRLNWASYGPANLVFEGLWPVPAIAHVLEEKRDQSQRSRDNGAKNALIHQVRREVIQNEALALMKASDITSPIPRGQKKGIVSQVMEKGYKRSTIYRALESF